MPTFISMLRGINVGGSKPIRMADLKAAYETLGLLNVQTYVNSGNVVFDDSKLTAPELATKIQAQLKKSFGHDIPVIIRTTADLKKVITHNPFLKGDREINLERLYITFLAATPAKADVKNLVVPQAQDDEFIIKGQEVFLYCPMGYGNTKLSNNLFEKKLKTAATSRNWRTVNALYQMGKDR
jgi:uncharacterized protein (DUF1697 family)